MTDPEPYAGRWVALIDDLVVGVGHTAEEALHFAQHNRPKERMKLRFVERSGGEALPAWPLLDRARRLLAEHPFPVYLVGGAVRDMLLGQVSHDLDFVVTSGAVELAFTVADSLGVPAYILDRERDTGRVIMSEGRTTLDFAAFRGPDLEADLRDRDFTINSMALPVSARQVSSVIDPCGGMSDLAVQHIQQTHGLAISSDPVRALRAIRLATSLGFTMTDETIQAVIKAGSGLRQVSVERVRDELIKLLLTRKPHEGIAEMADKGLLAVTIPEIAALAEVDQSPPLTEPVLAHTISVLHWLTGVEKAIRIDPNAKTPTLESVQSALSRYARPLADHLERRVDGGLDGRILLRLGALFHDVGKKDTRTVESDGRVRFLGHDLLGAKLAGRRLRKMHLSSEAVAHVQRLVAGHLRLLSLVSSHLPDGASSPPISRRTVHRFFRDTGIAGIDIGLLTLADHLGTYNGAGEGHSWQQLLRIVAELFHHYFENYSDTVAPRPFVNGRELMEALCLEPGPEVGRLLRLIEEAQAAGEITSRLEALHFARKSRQ